MLITSIRPSTVDGIKQLAKKIKRESSTTHTPRHSTRLAVRRGTRTSCRHDDSYPCLRRGASRFTCRSIGMNVL